MLWAGRPDPELGPLLRLNGDVSRNDDHGCGLAQGAFHELSELALREDGRPL